jgi:hypothetical protein
VAASWYWLIRWWCGCILVLVNTVVVRLHLDTGKYGGGVAASWYWLIWWWCDCILVLVNMVVVWLHLGTG